MKSVVIIFESHKAAAGIADIVIFDDSRAAAEYFAAMCSVGKACEIRFAYQSHDLPKRLEPPTHYQPNLL